MPVKPSVSFGLRRLIGGAPPAPIATPAAKAAPTRAEMRGELRERLLVHDPQTQMVRHLYQVYKQLGIDGWPGAAMMQPTVVHRAVCEAEMLQSTEPSPLLGLIVDKLRAIDSVAILLAEPDAPATGPSEWATTAVPEVSETSYADYEMMERSWIGTVPSGLERPPLRDA